MNYLYKTLLCFLLLFLGACLTPKNRVKHRDGYYKISVLNNKKNVAPVFFGKVYDELGGPFKGALLQIDDNKYQSADTLGKFLFSLPAGKHKLTAKNISYKFLTIKKINASLGDSISIDFYLKQDTTIILH